MRSPMPSRRPRKLSPAASGMSLRRAAVLLVAAVLIAACSDGPTAPSTFTLTVDKAGLEAAGAIVTSSPAGIDCGATCTASFEGGTVVTLTTTAAGSVIDGWSGVAGCSGTDDCTVTLDDDATITASYRGVRVAIGASPQSCLRNEGEVGERVMGLLEGRGHTAEFASAAELDEMDEITAYDVVVIGGPGAGCAQSDVNAYGGAIVDYVRAGGGVVGSGWLLYDERVVAPDLFDALPLVREERFMYGPATVTPVGTSPITAELGPFDIVDYLPYGGAVKPGAAPLLTVGAIVVGAQWTLDAGRTVFLGPLFMESYRYINEGLLDGSQQSSLELFLRAVEWAAGAR